MITYEYNGMPILAPVTIESEEPASVSDTISLRQIRTTRGSQRWLLSFGVSAQDGQADLLVGIVQDVHTAKLLDFPQLPQVYDATTANGAFNVSATEPAGERQISVSGSGLIPKGSFINFSNHTKLYLVTENRSGSGSLQIYPGLRTGVASGVTVNHAKSPTPARLRYRQNIDTLTGINFEDGILVSIDKIVLTEAL